MMNIIVPTDFSDTANNAVRYAVRMLKGTYDTNLVLYHVYEKADDEADVSEAIELLRRDLMELGPMKMEIRTEQSTDVTNSIERLARHLSADLIVMGITGKSWTI